jgi:hypothetical protein
MPCDPSSISLPSPSGPSGPPLPGFGLAHALTVPDIAIVPGGFPEDLLEIFNTLQMLTPVGIMKPQLSVNWGKDIYDGIMKLLDQFMPFLMMYQLILPILNLIICLIEVICAIPNPFKLAAAIIKLFRTCLPPFLNLFPIFAMIIMIISLLLLLLALIEYLISQILKLIQALLRNINALVKAFQDADSSSILAIARKIGNLLCTFQNLFVLLSLFSILIQIIKDILSLVSSIPPCGDSSNCCTPDVCPAIVKNSYTRTTANLQYFNRAKVDTGIVLPPPFGNFSVDARAESWQIYDAQQLQAQEFINIVDAFDVASPKPIFFPTDATYTAQTPPNQAAYTVDLRLYYDPTNWGRIGPARFIRFKNCIVLKAPTKKLTTYNNNTQDINNGVLLLAGGLGYEDDSTTTLTGFAPDGITAISDQATLENFLHKADIVSTNPTLSPTDGYLFGQAEYTFVPHIETLFSKNLVTLGCIPAVALNKDFANSVFAGDIALKGQELSDLLNGVFPNPAGAQQCLGLALSDLRSNLTPDGVAQFQATTTICLQKLKDDTSGALGALVGIGFDPCKSKFSLNPDIQFTSKPIVVSANLNERNGLSLTTGLSADVAQNIAARLKAHITFGDISNFAYDGYQAFTANLTSNDAGTGQIMISFDDNIFCTNIIPTDTTVNPEHTLQSLTYKFVHTLTIPIVPTAEGDTDGKPQRNESDLAGEGSDSGGG